jgi:hypothetical protein
MKDTCAITGCPIMDKYHRPIPVQCALTDQQKDLLLQLERGLCPHLTNHKRIMVSRISCCWIDSNNLY